MECTVESNSITVRSEPMAKMNPEIKDKILMVISYFIAGIVWGILLGYSIRGG